MPEKTGTITGFIQKKDGTNFGLNLDGEEYLYSFPDKRGEPWDADNVNVGDSVRIEYSPYEKDGKTKQYIAVIERLGDASEPSQTLPDAPQLTVSGKDTLIAKISSVKTAGELYAACITAGLVKELPTPAVIKAYAEAIEAKL